MCIHHGSISHLSGHKLDQLRTERKIRGKRKIGTRSLRKEKYLWPLVLSLHIKLITMLESPGTPCRPTILGKSQPAKNRKLSRLISNLSRLNWSSERNSVYCFSTVFTLVQLQEVPSIRLPRNLPC